MIRDAALRSRGPGRDRGRRAPRPARSGPATCKSGVITTFVPCSASAQVTAARRGCGHPATNQAPGHGETDIWRHGGTEAWGIAPSCHTDVRRLLFDGRHAGNTARRSSHPTPCPAVSFPRHHQPDPSRYIGIAARPCIPLPDHGRPSWARIARNAGGSGHPADRPGWHTPAGIRQASTRQREAPGGRTRRPGRSCPDSRPIGDSQTNT